MTPIDRLCVDTIRFLAVDAVEKALVFEHRRQIARYGKVFEPDEARQTAEATLARSIGAVLPRISHERIGLPCW